MPNLSPHRAKLRSVGLLVLAAALAGADPVKSQAQLMVEALERGEIPAELREDWRVVPENHPDAVKFQTDMERIASRMYRQDMKRNPVRFLLLDDDRVEAFTSRRANPPIIAMSRGLLAKLANEDQLAWVLGHEWTHGQFARRFGNRLRNTKVEELTADALPLHYLFEANYDPREAPAAARAILGSGKKSEVWAQILDVHPLDANRIATLNVAVGALDRKVGGFADRTPTDLSSNAKAATATRGHVSFVDAQLATHGYESKSPEEKLAILESLVRSNQQWNDRRVRELTQAIRKVNPADPKAATFVTARNALANQLLDRVVATDGKTADGKTTVKALGAMYEALSTVAFPDSQRAGARPMGRLIPLANATREFRDAQDAEDAEAAAEKMIARLKALNVPREFLRDHIAFAQFDYPDDPDHLSGRQKRKPVAWNDHVAWASDSQKIVRGLLMMGVFEPRIFAEARNETYEALAADEGEPFSLGPRDGAHRMHHLRLREDGSVREIQETFREDTSTQRVNLDRAVADRRRAEMRALVPAALRGDRAARRRIEVLSAQLPLVPGELEGVEVLAKDWKLFDMMNSRLPSFDTGDVANHRQLATHLRAILSGTDGKARENVRQYLGLNTNGRTRFRWNSTHNALEDPLFQLMVENPGGHFDALALHTTVAATFGSENSHARPWMRKFIGYSEPKTGEELMALAERFADGTVLEKGALEAEAIAFLRAQPKGPIRGFLPLRFTQLFLRPARSSNDENAYQNGIAERFRVLIAERMASVPSEAWPSDPLARAALWQQMRSANVFPGDGAVEKKVLESLLEAAKTETDSGRQLKLLETILFGRTIRYPELRTQAQTLWTAAAARVYGLDDGSTGYRRRLDPMLRQMEQHAGRNDRVEMLALLGKELVAQRLLAQQLRTASMKVDAKQLKEADEAFKFAEALQTLTVKNGPLRTQVMDYLLSENDPALEQSLYEELEKSAHLFAFDHGANLDSAVQRFIRDRLRADIKAMYENFWASPIEGRALFIERVVLPDALADPSKGYHDAFNFAAERLFPEGSRYGVESRAFLRAYFTVVPDYQKRVLLSVLLSASRQSAAAGQTSIGERLAYVLEMLGPAETKLGQALHSHPSTPEDIRAGMPRLKARAAEPQRWDLIDMYYEQVPERERGRVRKLGRVLGSASYYVVVEVEMKDGSRQALALLRPHGRERAENGFELMEAMTGQLNLDLSPDTVAVVRELLAQSRSSAAAETDSAAARRQWDHASPLYTGRGFSLEGQEFRFHLPRTLRSGPGFRFMELAQGQHFNELPEKTDGEKLRKRQIAKGYLAFELALILQGGVFDHDRHGAQMRIRGNDIFLFDWGGMALDPPTEAQRRQLGEVFAVIAPALLQGGDIGPLIFEQMRLRRARNEDVEYLGRVQKALLALNDFRRHLLPSDLAEVLRAAGTQGVHPEIQAAATEALMRRADFGALMQMASVFAPPANDAECLKLLSF